MPAVKVILPYIHSPLTLGIMITPHQSPQQHRLNSHIVRSSVRNHHTEYYATFASVSIYRRTTSIGHPTQINHLQLVPSTTTFLGQSVSHLFNVFPDR